MAWVEAHQTLGNHPKLKSAARDLGISKAQLIGHLFYLWWWCLDYAIDGNLEKFASDQIADGANWEGDPDDFLKAIVCAGFVDEGPGPDSSKLKIHDWFDFCGDLVKKRLEYQAAKKDRSQRIIGDSQRKEEISQPTIPYRTVPNSTIPTPLPAAAELPANAFELIWVKYPRPLGRKAAEKHFNASVKTMKDYLDIQNALENYKRHIRISHTETKFIQHGSTWFNNWRDYVNYTPQAPERRAEPVRAGSGYIGHEPDPDVVYGKPDVGPVSQAEFERIMAEDKTKQAEREKHGSTQKSSGDTVVKAGVGKDPARGQNQGPES